MTLSLTDPRGGEAGQLVQWITTRAAPRETPFASKAAAPGRLRDLCLETWAACRQDWRKAAPIVRDAMRNARWLHSRERRDFSEHLYQMIKSERLLTFLLDRAALSATVGSARRDLAMHLAGLCHEWGLSPEEAASGWGGSGVDWAAVSDASHTLLGWVIEQQPPLHEALAVAASFPDWIVRTLLTEQRGRDCAALLRAWNDRAPLWVRVNEHQRRRDDVVAALTARGVRTRLGRWSPLAVELVDRIDVFSLPELHAGDIDVQDEGSQLVAEVVGAKPGERVVDACAGAGGKSLALASAMRLDGKILASDVREGVLRHALKRAKRGAGRIIEAVAIPETGPLPSSLASWMGLADRVLVDAPCSGTGALRRNPEARWHLSPLEAAAKPPVQSAILDRFAPLVRPGGVLVYATCAVGSAENDAVTDAFLKRRTDFRTVPLADMLGEERAAELGGDCLRLRPEVHGTDGFYARVMRRSGG